jgi:hypothetical protein
LVAAGLIGLAGCTGDDGGDVATFDTPGQVRGTTAASRSQPAENSVPSQPLETAEAPSTNHTEASAGAVLDRPAHEKTVENLVSCLQAAGAPADVLTLDNGWTTYTFHQAESLAGTDPEGWFLASGVTEDLIAELRQAHEAGEALRLYVDGTAYSVAWNECYYSSGYTEPPDGPDPADELLQKQGVAAATNEWAACARENGVPGIADATATEGSEWPIALIPPDISAGELRALLQECPNFDPKRATAAAEAGAGPSEYNRLYAQPSVGIDQPPGLFESGKAINAEELRLDELFGILKEAEIAWRVETYGPKVDG